MIVKLKKNKMKTQTIECVWNVFNFDPYNLRFVMKKTTLIY